MSLKIQSLFGKITFKEEIKTNDSINQGKASESEKMASYITVHKIRPENHSHHTKVYLYTTILRERVKICRKTEGTIVVHTTVLEGRISMAFVLQLARGIVSKEGYCYLRIDIYFYSIERFRKIIPVFRYCDIVWRYIASF